MRGKTSGKVENCAYSAAHFFRERFPEPAGKLGSCREGRVSGGFMNPRGAGVSRQGRDFAALNGLSRRFGAGR
jgi:hypothetical protein